MAAFEDFQKLDIRLGKIISAELLPNAKYTTHKLRLDFGPEVGEKTSGARVINYSLEQLTGKLVLGVVNLPPRQIGHVRSEVLILGVPGPGQECILVAPDNPADLGSKLY